MENKKLFIVEFGEPSSSFTYSQQQPIYVVAIDYNDAAEKALAYVEYKKTINPKKILTHDGSLNNETDEVVKIKGIKIASEEVVW